MNKIKELPYNCKELINLFVFRTIEDTESLRTFNKICDFKPYNCCFLFMNYCEHKICALNASLKQKFSYKNIKNGIRVRFIDNYKYRFVNIKDFNDDLFKDIMQTYKNVPILKYDSEYQKYFSFFPDSRRKISFKLEVYKNNKIIMSKFMFDMKETNLENLVVNLAYNFFIK